jgi:hypothetical protein
MNEGKPFDVINLPLVMVITVPLIETIRINKFSMTEALPDGLDNERRVLNQASKSQRAQRSVKIDLLWRGRC